jgi:hypothetical protein
VCREDLAQASEHDVSDIVAEPVVDRFEVVDIDHHDGVFGGFAAHLVVGAVEGRDVRVVPAPVRQAGQFVHHNIAA